MNKLINTNSYFWHIYLDTSHSLRFAKYNKFRLLFNVIWQTTDYCKNVNKCKTEKSRKTQDYIQTHLISSFYIKIKSIVVFN